MAKILVYDPYANKIYTYPNLSESDPMPYSYGTTLRVREFRGSSSSPTLWTTTAAMEAWNLTRRKYGKGIYVGYAFKRIWEGGHSTTSQHYAGVAFDVGQNTTAAARKQIWQAAKDSTRTLDGKFGPNTLSALKAFQCSVGLSADGVCGCNTWKKLTSAALGIGRTATVLN